MDKDILHTGIVMGLDGDKVHILIEQHSACSACYSRSACLASDKKEKVIIVEKAEGDYQLGETVELLGKSSTGLWAVLFAFVIPFLIILLSLIVLQYVNTSDAVSAVIALALLIPYYLILSLFNKKLNKKLQFYIQKTEND